MLSKIGTILNLKENRYLFQGLSSTESVPISAFVKVFTFQRPPNSDDEAPDEVTKVSQGVFFQELTYEDNPSYLVKTAEIFPLDFDINERGNPKLHKNLRPEFLAVYDKALKADTRKVKIV